MPIPLLIVGGFLGAGKTTLLHQAARRLSAAGRRVGIVTNDQAADLVDTGLLSVREHAVEEVSGSCFCCDFQALRLPGGGTRAPRCRSSCWRSRSAAAPICAATILQPLRDRYASRFRLARLSVLVDPLRLHDVIGGRAADGLHPSARYILRKQLEEADILVVNKAETLPPAERSALRARLESGFPGQEIRFMSALAGDGVDEWLAAAQGEGAAGARILDVDYDTYAEGEAVLGWLNARIDLASTGEDADWRAFCASLMGLLQDAFDSRGLPVGHVKLLLSTADAHLFASLTRTGGRVHYEGDVGRSSAAALLLNARVQTAPATLEAIVRGALATAAQASVQLHVRTLRSLSPGRPVPTFRYTAPSARLFRLQLGAPRVEPDAIKLEPDAVTREARSWPRSSA